MFHLANSIGYNAKQQIAYIIQLMNTCFVILFHQIVEIYFMKIISKVHSQQLERENVKISKICLHEFSCGMFRTNIEHVDPSSVF